MELGIYWSVFAILGLSIVLLTSHRYIFALIRRAAYCNALRSEDVSGLCEKDREAVTFRRVFLQVYLLVMASEWLQGPYLYPLLRDEKNLAEPTVAALFVTAYVAAALSAFAVGVLADRFGRRAACFAFCVLHSTSCLTVLSNNLAILFLGRTAAGISLTLLWTVFESWMVTEYNGRGLHESSISLSSLFGTMTTSNCMAAILAGVVSDWIVLAVESRTVPFVASVPLEVFAAILMFKDWNENSGWSQESVPHGEHAATSRLGADKRVWVLSFISCCFEGTNFLVLFFWPGTMQDAHRLVQLPGMNDDVPYGVVFATFMASMILGAYLFKNLVRIQPENAREFDQKRVRQLVSSFLEPHVFLASAISLAALSLLAAAFAPTEIGTLGAFLGFETCNGIYVPSIAYQRVILIPEYRRAGQYALMKIPLFVFVTVALCTAVEGESHRQIIFVSCCGVLLLAAIATLFGLAPITRHDSRRLDELEPREEELQDGCVDGSEKGESPRVFAGDTISIRNSTAHAPLRRPAPGFPHNHPFSVSYRFRESPV